jgi:diguanylate cyclase (GGDEF)-like protein
MGDHHEADPGWRKGGDPMGLPILPSVIRLPRTIRCLVLTVFAGYLGFVAWGLSTVEVTRRGLVMEGVFVVAAVLSVEVSLRLAWPRTKRDRASRDFLGVWMLPVALVLPPIYVGLVVVPSGIYIWLRAWRGDPIKTTFSIASLGLAYAAASATFAATGGESLTVPTTTHRLLATPREVAAVFFAVAAWWVVNHLLIMAAVGLTGTREDVVAFLRDREGFAVDMVDACMGTVVAVLWVVNPFMILLIAPPVLLLQHQLFSGLRQAVRTDLLTDVANPQYWREVAGRELERAAASGCALSLFMVDVDHFKAVNDKYGHLTGDEVIAAVARTVAQAVRPRDIVGRLGGEEFGVVLSGLTLLEAQGAAERMRSAVSDVKVRAANGDWVGVTISVGVAELSVTGGDLRNLLDAADSALYAAKAAGRNCVRAADARVDRLIDLDARRVRDLR